MSEAKPFERWPGYDRQSWQERFATLDKQHSDFMAKLPVSLRKYADRERALSGGD